MTALIKLILLVTLIAICCLAEPRMRFCGPKLTEKIAAICTPPGYKRLCTHRRKSDPVPAKRHTDPISRAIRAASDKDVADVCCTQGCTETFMAKVCCDSDEMADYLQQNPPLSSS